MPAIAAWLATPAWWQQGKRPIIMKKLLLFLKIVIAVLTIVNLLIDIFV